MKLHPAEIANEVKFYPFFNIFTEPMLLQLCTMIEVRDYAPGECILVEGQTNQNLFFLRKGVAEAYLNNQKIIELSRPGDVMGEMSVVTGKVASTTIVALDSVEVFSIDTNYFNHFKSSDKERFEMLFYKMLSHILSERLLQENIKNTSLKYL